jgi:hypothetical protein
MPDDQDKPKKEAFIDRAGKAKVRLQQSLPEIQHLMRTSNAVEMAQSIFRQFADDIQLKDLLAKAEALVANTNRTFTRPAPTDASPAETLRDVTPSNNFPREAPVKKTKSKRARPKKAAPKKTASKKKKKPAPRRKAKTRL